MQCRFACQRHNLLTPWPLHVYGCARPCIYPALLYLQGVSPNILTETLSASSPEVNSLQPGDLFDVELSKIDSSLGISVTVLFVKVSALSLFSPLLPFDFLCVCVVVFVPLALAPFWSSSLGFNFGKVDLALCMQIFTGIWIGSFTNGKAETL